MIFIKTKKAYFDQNSTALFYLFSGVSEGFFLFFIKRKQPPVLLRKGCKHKGGETLTGTNLLI
jgi:hypothetical protein